MAVSENICNFARAWWSYRLRVVGATSVRVPWIFVGKT